MDEDFSDLIEAEMEAIIAERLLALVQALEAKGLRNETILAGLDQGMNSLRQASFRARLSN